jgi:hypothetical protein
MKAIETQKLLMLKQKNNQVTVLKTPNNKAGMETIRTANIFLNDANSFAKYSEVTIDEKQIKCIFSLGNEQEYYNLISSLEGRSEYKVKTISPLKSGLPEASSAEVLLEVVK